jgi:20S proteasome alpha/beta subunit
VSATTAGGSSEFKAAAVSLEPTTTTRNGNTTIGVDNEGGVLLQTAHATATDNGVSTRGRQIIATDDQVEISSASSSASPDRLHVTGSRLLVS